MDDTGGILKTSDLNPHTLPNVAKLILDTDDRTVTLLKNFGQKKTPPFLMRSLKHKIKD
jgi:hypothetical protein